MRFLIPNTNNFNRNNTKIFKTREIQIVKELDFKLLITTSMWIPVELSKNIEYSFN